MSAPHRTDEGRAPLGVTERYLLHLFARGLSGEAPDEIPAGCSWEGVFDLAVRNAVTGLVWAAAGKLGSVPDELRAAWKSAAGAIFMRNVQLEAERCEIMRRLEGAGVSCLPLKGSAILPLYASPAMRTMCDNDVLFGIVEPAPEGGYRVSGEGEDGRRATLERAGSVVRDVMLGMGYAVDEHGGDVCDIQFTKPPYYRYEMHFSLMERHRPYYFYFANPWLRALPVDGADPRAGEGCEFRFPPEDAYVYMIVHAHKHEHMSGEGVRILADIAVTLRARGDGFDLAYVEDELSRMGLADFERALRELSLAVAAERTLDSEQEGLVAQMLSCGQVVSVERFVRERVSQEREASGGRWGRLGYVAKLCSPDYYCPGKLAVFARHRMLRPLFPLGRIALFLRNAARSPRWQLRKVLALVRGQ